MKIRKYPSIPIKRVTCLLVTISAQLCSTSLVQAKIQSKQVGPLQPQEQLATFTLADGFVIELVASEEHGIINPIDLTFDDAGRLWTQTAQMYPLDPVTGISFGDAVRMMKDKDLAEKYPRVSEIQDYYTLKTRGTDKILILDDPTKTATAPLHVWADGLAIPQSIYPHKDGCYVAHGSEFFFLRDTDGDGKQDQVETEMSGFGFFDTHTLAHSIVRGPGGWLNFTHGALNSGDVTLMRSGKKMNITYAKNLRYKMNGEALEVVGIARDNVWGYQVRANGQWYATSANDGGVSVLPVEDQTTISGIGGDKVREYQPTIHTVHDFRVGGTGISGLAFSEDGDHGFPAEWQDIAFLANPITRKINCVRIERLPSGKIEAELLPDLLSCTDSWFRPVNIEMGPDGCLYIADWYNKIVAHNQVSTDHPDRDRSHGRIWRIRHVSQQPFQIPNVASAESSALLEHLKNGKTLWEKRAAWQQITDRNVQELAPALAEILLNHQQYAIDTAILALWSLEGLQTFHRGAIDSALSSLDGDLRREAVRSLASYSLSAEVVADLLTPYVDDENVMVRSQVIRTLEEVGVANLDTIGLLVAACKEPGLTKAFGAGYEESFERFLARKALESYPVELQAYFDSPRGQEHPSSHVLWASQALPAEQRLAFFLKNWQEVSSGQIDEGTFISVSELLHSPEMQKAVAPVFQQRTEEMLELTLATRESVNLPSVTIYFKSYIEQLLASPSTRAQGLEVIQKLASPHHFQTLLKLLQTEENSHHKKAIMDALGITPTKIPVNLLKENFQNEGSSFNERLDAIAALYLRNPGEATTLVGPWLETLSQTEQERLVSRLYMHRQVIEPLLEFTGQGKIQASAWNSGQYNSFGRRYRNTKGGREIASYLQKHDAALATQRHEKIQKYVKAVETLKGNPQTGQAVFQACLACHQVGDQGVKVGPPLDGSANRDIEHLLTAIVDPDAAVEGAYGAYYVAKHDGTVIDGMPKRKTSRGITLIAAGGVETFIPQHLIRAEGNRGRSSFMPSSFGTLPEQTMVDLVTYIMTLN